MLRTNHTLTIMWLKLVLKAILDEHGYLVDIVDIEAGLDGIVDYFRDTILNDKPEFEVSIRVSNTFPEFLIRNWQKKLKWAYRTLSVKLWENESCWAAYKSEI